MKYMLTGVLACILLTGCGQNDKPTGQAALASVEFNADDLPSVLLRDGDPATAPQALAAFHLAESGSGILSFESKDIDGDKAVFTNVTLSVPETEASSEPYYTDEEVAELFAFMDFDGDGIADDGSELTLKEYGEMLNSEEEAAPKPVIKAAKLEFDGLGVFDGQPNFSLMRFSDITVTPVEGSADRSNGTIGTVELVNPSAELAGWVANAFGGDDSAELPQGSAIAFDRWAIDKVNLNVEDDSGTGAFKLDSLFVSELKEEKIGKMGLSNLLFDFNEPDMGDMKIALDGFGLTGLDYGLIASAASGSGDPVALAETLQADPTNPGFDALVMKGLKADVIGASLDMADFNSYVGRDNQGRATKVTTDPFTLKVSARDNADGEEFAGALATLGYETLTLSGEAEQHYDPETDIVTMPKGKNYWTLENGFKLDVSTKYEGARALAAVSSTMDENTDPDVLMNTILNELSFHQLELNLKDDGFFNRALNAYAAQSGEDPAQVRAQMAGMMAMAPMFASGTGIDPAVVTEFASALSSFVQDPKTLTISFAPPAPVKAQAFVDAASDPTKKLDKATLGFAATNK